MFLNPANLRDMSVGSEYDGGAVLLRSQFGGKLLFASCELVHGGDLLLPLQKIRGSEEIFPKGDYS